MVGLDVLIHLGPVDVDLHDLGLGGEAGRMQGDAVGEAAAHGDEQVAAVAGHVGGLGAVHADHAGGQGMAAGEAAAAHDGDGHRGVDLFREFPELFMGAADDHAAAADQQRFFRSVDHFQQLVQVLTVRLRRFEL